MNGSIGMDYSAFCGLYYAEAEKMADMTVAGYIKKHGPLSRHIDTELVKDLGISYALEKVYCEYDGEHESNASIGTFMSKVVHNSVLTEIRREKRAVGEDFRDSSYDFSKDPETDTEREKNYLCDYISASDPEVRERLVADVLSCVKGLKPIDQVIISCWMSCPKGQYTEMALSELNMDDNVRNRETVQRRCFRAIDSLRKKMEEKRTFGYGEIMSVFNKDESNTFFKISIHHTMEEALVDSESKLEDVEKPLSCEEKVLHYRFRPMLDLNLGLESSCRRNAAEQSITARIDYDQLSRTLLGMAATGQVDFPIESGE
ncbi:MAG: hypothetical protein ACI4TU_00755 [Candidatus Cryptobacteroides sp.]